MQALKAKIDKNKTYSVAEAVKIVKETSNVKFNATVELHARLGIDPSKSEQQIRSTVVLPHGTGKTKKIAAFVSSKDEAAAKEAGADLICGEEEIKKIKDTGKIDFEIAVATPEMMPKLTVAAKVLGPKGMMPNPKTGTVDPDIKKIINELKKGKITFKNDDTANLHTSVGKANFSEKQLEENVAAMVEALKKAKPSSAKGVFIKGIYLTSSMGPSVKIAVN